MQTLFKGKHDQLKKEKAENDQWRKKAREEIREEFQDIRDLVMNNRLMNALRQAKNLIDFLEKNAEEGMADEG